MFCQRGGLSLRSLLEITQPADAWDRYTKLAPKSVDRFWTQEAMDGPRIKFFRLPCL